MLFKQQHMYNHVEGSLKQIPGTHSALLIQQSVPRTGIPNKFPGDAMTSVLETTLSTTGVERNYMVTVNANTTKVTNFK